MREQKWQVKLYAGGKQISGGVFDLDDERAAAEAYDALARKHLGDAAVCNFVGDERNPEVRKKMPKRSRAELQELRAQPPRRSEYRGVSFRAQLQRWLRDCGLGVPAASPAATTRASRGQGSPTAAPEATVWVVAELGGGLRRRELDGAEILRQALVCERGGSSEALEHALRCGDSLGKRKLLRKALAFLLANSGRASDDGTA